MICYLFVLLRTTISQFGTPLAWKKGQEKSYLLSIVFKFSLAQRIKNIYYN